MLYIEHENIKLVLFININNYENVKKYDRDWESSWRRGVASVCKAWH